MHVHAMMNSLVDLVAHGNADAIESLEVPDLPKNIASAPIPDKQLLIEQHKSRFQTN